MCLLNYLLLIFVLIIQKGLCGENLKRPNIVLIVADDLGWDDVSFHGSSQVLTPNIDLLAYTGVAMHRYYSHCVCTPSRAALLSGNFAHRTGMQGYPLTNAESRGLPLDNKILPQFLKELGYATHLVGKWHLGHFKTPYLPTQRGFDTHFGHRGGYVDYYEYVLRETWSIGDFTGFDLYRDNEPAWDVEGYLTDVYNEKAKSVIQNHNTSEPLFLMLAHIAPHSGNDGALMQAPAATVRQMRHVEHAERRTFAAMVKTLDDSVGDVVNALNDKGILENTIIAFVSDNGGMTSGDSQNFASNWPLRGLKMSPFEGGVRVVGAMWAPFLNQSNHIWKGYIHVADWLPTLVKAAGGEPPTNIDGINLWEKIISNEVSSREEMYEINDYVGFSAIISGDYKLIVGNVIENYSNYQGEGLREIIGIEPSYNDAIENSKMYKVLDSIGRPFYTASANMRNDMRIDCGAVHRDTESCLPNKDKACLYNIRVDPCETVNIAEINPDIVEKLEAKLAMQMAKTIRRVVPVFRDPRAAPKLHNYTWAVWAENLAI